MYREIKQQTALRNQAEGRLSKVASTTKQVNKLRRRTRQPSPADGHKYFRNLLRQFKCTTTGGTVRILFLDLDGTVREPASGAKFIHEFFSI